MNKAFHKALALASATILFSTVAAAGATSYLKDGTYGDPNVATLTVTNAGATITLPCQIDTFSSRIETTVNEKTGVTSFKASGYAVSGVDMPNPEKTPIEIEGTVVTVPVLCPVGIACNPITNISATVTYLETNTKPVTYQFSSGEAGAVVTCL